MNTPDAEFDFLAHRRRAVDEYRNVHPFFQQFAATLKQLIEATLGHRRIKVQSVQARAKDPLSFGDKAAQPSETDSRRPKYPFPLTEITDLAGVRIIAYLPNTLNSIDLLMKEEFAIIEKTDKGAKLIEDEKFGYQSVHYLVKLSSARASLPEYIQFSDKIAEIQVRTVLQHAWAEIEHDIQYKSVSVIPNEVRRRFMSLAGLLEIADREFQAIQEADTSIKERARTQVQAGNLQEIEITPDSLRAFLDKRLGSDGRMSEPGYSWFAKLLKQLGFQTLEQVDHCIQGYNDDTLSRIATGGRQGQLSRFELMLLAGMGKYFIDNHFMAHLDAFREANFGYLDDFMKNDIEIREYDPRKSNSDSRGTEGTPAP